MLEKKNTLIEDAEEAVKKINCGSLQASEALKTVVGEYKKLYNNIWSKKCKRDEVRGLEDFAVELESDILSCLAGGSNVAFQCIEAKIEWYGLVIKRSQNRVDICIKQSSRGWKNEVYVPVLIVEVICIGQYVNEYKATALIDYNYTFTARFVSGTKGILSQMIQRVIDRDKYNVTYNGIVGMAVKSTMITDSIKSQLRGSVKAVQSSMDSDEISISLNYIGTDVVMNVDKEFISITSDEYTCGKQYEFIACNKKDILDELKVVVHFSKTHNMLKEAENKAYAGSESTVADMESIESDVDVIEKSEYRRQVEAAKQEVHTEQEEAEQEVHTEEAMKYVYGLPDKTLKRKKADKRKEAADGEKEATENNDNTEGSSESSESSLEGSEKFQFKPSIGLSSTKLTQLLRSARKLRGILTQYGFTKYTPEEQQIGLQVHDNVDELIENSRKYEPSIAAEHPACDLGFVKEVHNSGLYREFYNGPRRMFIDAYRDIEELRNDSLFIEMAEKFEDMMGMPKEMSEAERIAGFHIGKDCIVKGAFLPDGTYVRMTIQMLENWNVYCDSVQDLLMFMVKLNTDSYSMDSGCIPDIIIRLIHEINSHRSTGTCDEQSYSEERCGEYVSVYHRCTTTEAEEKFEVVHGIMILGIYVKPYTDNSDGTGACKEKLTEMVPADLFANTMTNNCYDELYNYGNVAPNVTVMRHDVYDGIINKQLTELRHNAKGKTSAGYPELNAAIHTSNIYNICCTLKDFNAHVQLLKTLMVRCRSSRDVKAYVNHFCAGVLDSVSDQAIGKDAYVIKKFSHIGEYSENDEVYRLKVATADCVELTASIAVRTGDEYKHVRRYEDFCCGIAELIAEMLVLSVTNRSVCGESPYCSYYVKHVVGKAKESDTKEYSISVSASGDKVAVYLELKADVRMANTFVDNYSGLIKDDITFSHGIPEKRTISRDILRDGQEVRCIFRRYTPGTGLIRFVVDNISLYAILNDMRTLSNCKISSIVESSSKALNELSVIDIANIIKHSLSNDSDTWLDNDKRVTLYRNVSAKYGLYIPVLEITDTEDDIRICAVNCDAALNLVVYKSGSVTHAEINELTLRIIKDCLEMTYSSEYFKNADSGFIASMYEAVYLASQMNHKRGLKKFFRAGTERNMCVSAELWLIGN